MKKLAHLLLAIIVLFASTFGEAAARKPVKELPFTKAELLDRNVRMTYEGDNLNLIAFPMGGIGSGCISLSGTGKLVDWEIFNLPNKGYQPRFTFLSVWAKTEGAKPVFKVLEGQLRERLDGPMYLAESMQWQGNGVGPQQAQASGLPRMRQCRFEGKFPFAKVYLADNMLPVAATIEGWSPFIPGNSRDSSLPVAVLTVTVSNRTNKTVDVVLAANIQNTAGEYNRVIREPGFCALYLHDGREDNNSVVLATPAAVTTWQENWRGGPNWRYDFMCLQHFADTFAAHGRFDSTVDSVAENGRNQAEESARGQPNASQADAVKRAGDENSKVGSLGVEMTLSPGQSRTVPLIIAWYFPTMTVPAGWWAPGTVSWRNYYATQWKSGLDVARYAIENLGRLEKETRLFQETFFASTIPGTVLEAISTQLSILRSTVLVRYPDGTLYGWEGTAPNGWAGLPINRRLGFGTCNHVYNYQQAIPYLFSDLQRSMLENFLFNGLRESDGAVTYRMPAGPGAKIDQKGGLDTAADGQLGQICQVYRDWQICGDDQWLKKIWPKTRKALEHAWAAWDKDRDGLLERSHHNTLDLNFKTPETMCGSLYQASLLAGERMALYVGDTEAAKEYRRVFESGKKLSDTKLFNGEYYHQMLPAPGRYQLGEGCISEQLHGQLYARMLGLEDIYSRHNIHTALGSLFKYNYVDSFYDRINTNRVYSIGGEGGLVIATWPKGGKPAHPLLYCDETMNGYEYQAAGNMLYEGYVLEGLIVIKSIRDRFDGKKRNPYCEFEWGNHYVRSMANYGALLALSGFRYSGVEKMFRLAPKVHEKDFRVFFSVDSGWGLASQKVTSKSQTVKVEVKKGRLAVRKLNLMVSRPIKSLTATLADREVGPNVQKAVDEFWDADKMVTVRLDETANITTGQPLTVNMRF